MPSFGTVSAPRSPPDLVEIAWQSASRGDFDIRNAAVCRFQQDLDLIVGVPGGEVVLKVAPHIDHRRTEQLERLIENVRAPVVQHSAAEAIQCLPVPPAAVDGVAVQLDHGDSAENAPRKNAPDVVEFRLVAAVEPQKELPRIPFGGLFEAHDLLDAHRNRFFNDHVFPRLQRLDRLRRVVRIAGGDGDEFHLRVGEQLRECGEGADARRGGGQVKKTVRGGVAPGDDFEEVWIRGEFRDVHLAAGAAETADSDFDFLLQFQLHG